MKIVVRNKKIFYLASLYFKMRWFIYYLRDYMERGVLKFLFFITRGMQSLENVLHQFFLQFSTLKYGTRVCVISQCFVYNYRVYIHMYC